MLLFEACSYVSPQKPFRCFQWCGKSMELLRRLSSSTLCLPSLKRRCPSQPCVHNNVPQPYACLEVSAVGNKNDDGRQPEVLDELAQDLAEENRLYLFQTSARDNVNVNECYSLSTHVVNTLSFRLYMLHFPTGLVFNQLAAMMLADRQKSREPDESTKLCERSIDSAYDVRKVFLSSEQKTPKKSCCSYFESPETKAHVV
ncbi:UNVERIFIED_CONTAM: hypothetical protein NCL1_33474 [Trichonephila clavipes]